MGLIADVGFAEATWLLVLKSLVIFAAILGIVPMILLLERFQIMALLIAYFLLTIEVGLATHSLGEFRISYFKLGPTELRILLSIGALVLIVKPTATIAGRQFLLFDVGGVVAIAGLAATFLISAIKNTVTLYRAEPIPGRRQ